MPKNAKKVNAETVEAAAVERSALAAIIERGLEGCSLKILRRMAKMVGARAVWSLPPVQ